MPPASTSTTFELPTEDLPYRPGYWRFTLILWHLTACLMWGSALLLNLW